MQVEETKDPKAELEAKSSEQVFEDGRGVVYGQSKFSTSVLECTQDLAVSDHGRTGRYHVLRIQRGID